ncbi:Tol-Pal system beta propeller repeat protein TolB [Piscinibacter sp.]|uniref:Tol-Pal system beta propeller repeat protein TolB n=1 Tax=Piscinibacter sp. TaxID=1903157 RepID=UPI002C16CD4B|nr:Tol-Pal system beta propeller repeat protein TolB [Albitalea sp.]HUG21930.1 Tol-Pal system beta propeller repeat protein TolB [Albitalea sp.]
MLNRRLFSAASGLLLATPAWSQFRVEISGVGANQVPIAIARFRDEDRTNQSLSAIVRADLERSGLFRSIDAPSVLDEVTQPALNEWRALAADALVGGSVSRLADGRYDVRFKLWDVVKGAELGGQSNAVNPADLRLAAHRISDFVHERLTGEKGVFSTRIAYVTKGGGRFTLRVADADGEGGQVALNSPEPIISPAWSPDGRELAYVSFERQKAIVYTQDVASGKRRVLANFRGSNSAPAWSPDGKSIAVTLSQAGGSQLYLMGRDGGAPRRLTNTSAIDTEPAFSPDGQTLYFVSDRGGSPQIYRMPVAGGGAERITFGGNYNISPAIGPDGRTLAYVSRQGNAFRLHTIDLGSPGSTPQALTTTNDDESPSFAPNGRLIIYATRADGRDVLMTTTLDGKIKARLVSTTADVREPVWGPFGR